MEIAALILGVPLALGAAGAARRRIAKKESEPESSERKIPPGFLVRQPSTALEALFYMVEGLRFLHSETFGRWAFMDLVVGLRYLSRREGEPHPTLEIFSKSVPLEWSPELQRENVALLQRFVSLSMALRESNPVTRQRLWDLLDYADADFFKQETKVGILRPMFTVVRDRTARCLIIAIRGTHSLKDTFTCLAGAQRPFHVFRPDGSLALGSCHCGVQSAARHIFTDIADLIARAVAEHPDLPVFTLGHSLGAATAVVLCSMLRERFPEVPQLRSCRCYAFACPAFMTADLAEAATAFTVSVVNGADMIPTFSHNQMDRLREEVSGSAWRDEFKRDLSNTRIYRAVTGVGQATRAAAVRVGEGVSALRYSFTRGREQRAEVYALREGGDRPGGAGGMTESPRGLGPRGGLPPPRPLEYRANLADVMEGMASASSKTLNSMRTAAGSVGSMLGPFLRRGFRRTPVPSGAPNGGGEAPSEAGGCVASGSGEETPEGSARSGAHLSHVEVASTSTPRGLVRGASPTGHTRRPSRLSSELDLIQAVLLSQDDALPLEFTRNRSPSMFSQTSGPAASIMDEDEGGPNADDLEAGVEDIEAYLADADAPPQGPEEPTGGGEARSPPSEAPGPAPPSLGREMLYPAGRILHLIPMHLVEGGGRGEEAAGEGQGEAAGEGHGPATEHPPAHPTAAAEPRWTLVEVDRSAYTRIRLCDSSIRDHFLASYAQALVSVGLSHGLPSSVVWGTVPRLFLRQLPIEVLDPSGHSESLRAHAALNGEDAGAAGGGDRTPPAGARGGLLTLSPARILSRTLGRVRGPPLVDEAQGIGAAGTRGEIDPVTALMTTGPGDSI